MDCGMELTRVKTKAFFLIQFYFNKDALIVQTQMERSHYLGLHKDEQLSFIY